jgi:hypothetical protein
MATTASGRPDREPVNWSGFDSEAHHAAQAACRHIIRCAVDGTTRRVVAQMLAYARRVGDGNLLLLTLAQLVGPCTLPPVPAVGTE